MDYQDRVRIITGRLNDFLRRYQRPPHLDNESALLEIRDMADEINSLISASSTPADLEARIDDCFRSIRQTYKQRAWPTSAHMVGAMDAASRVKAKVEGGVSGGYSPDDHQLNADRIKAGEKVGDSWLFGRLAAQMLNKGLVTEGDLRPYRSALYFSAKDVYGQEKAERMEAEWKARHEAGLALEKANA